MYIYNVVTSENQMKSMRLYNTKKALYNVEEMNYKFKHLGF